VTSPRPRPGTVILRPNLDGLPKLARRPFALLAMTDLGDHVEWTDGKRTTKMRLPDQPDTGAGYPVRAAVLVAAFRPSVSYAPGALAFYRIRFLDPSGRVIARLGRQPNTPRGAPERVLPEPDAYQALLDRGVRLEHAVYRDEKAFFEDHPDPRVQGFSLSFARNPMLWIGGPVLTVVVLVLIVMAAMGKFSS
jgi:hypothetical protein